MCCDIIIFLQLGTLWFVVDLTPKSYDGGRLVPGISGIATIAKHGIGVYILYYGQE